MLDPTTWKKADFDPDQGPLLAVVIDTEEEFDWGKPVDRASTRVQSIRHQVRAQKVFAEFGIVPTYVIDYPVASQPDGYGPLKEIFADGACDIGAHLHPWVNPPHDEEVCNLHSYPGNLPAELEARKLEVLKKTIEDNFGHRVRAYRAGRYGVGGNSTRVLRKLGFDIDSSIVPGSDFRRDEGPNFLACGPDPYWFAGGEMLEIPVTAGYVGLLGDAGKRLYWPLSGPTGTRLRIPGILARLGLLERIRLSPEGIPFEDLRRLTRAMLARGHRVFTFSYHSPSMDVGHTPYVQSQADLDGFLDTLRRYFDFFINEVGGQPATLAQIRDSAR